MKNSEVKNEHSKKNPVKISFSEGLKELSTKFDVLSKDGKGYMSVDGID